MSEQLQSDFDKIVKNSKFSNREIEFKKDFLNKFIESGFPNRRQEDWKFLDISQIIKKNISDLSYFIDYSQSNKISPDTSYPFFPDRMLDNVLFPEPFGPIIA